MSILAIDFGIKRLGLAISTGILAQPLKVLAKNEKIFENLKKICQEYSVKKMVIGLPEGKLHRTVLNFANNCKEKLGIEVEFEDETLTTVDAARLLIEAKTSSKKRKAIIDAAAAALILQQHLDKKKSNCNK